MTPSGLIVWYYAVREDLGAPGLNFIDSTGRIYHDDCGHCGYRFSNPTKTGEQVCGKCGQLWGFDDCFILKGEVQTHKRTDSFERKNERWATIGMLLSRMLAGAEFYWDFRLYIATCHGFSVDPQKDMHGEVNQLCLADMFQRLWPKAPGPWGRTMLYGRVLRAKKEWASRLQKAGIKTT